MALSGCLVSSCHWGCGAVAARALQGRGGEGGGGRLGSARYSPGTQKTGRQTKELGSGAEAPGSGRAAMAEPGAAQTPETAEPCGGIPTTELRPSHLTPSVLCTPPRSAAVQWGAVRRGPRLLLRREGKLEDSKGLFFWTHHFPQPPQLFLPPLLFFAFCHIMRLAVTYVTSVGSLVPPTYFRVHVMLVGKGRLIAAGMQSEF